ncbi:MAG: chloroperoxidase [Planctomycetota bacterium]
MTALRLAAIALLTVSSSDARADVVLDWNRVARDVIRANTSLQDPGNASRSMAMMNLAIYDAVAMTDPSGTMYYDYGLGNASPGYALSHKAAASQAAFEVLSSLYPDQQSTIDAALTSSLGGVTAGTAKTEGVALGTMVGRSIITRRQNDGFDTSSQYVPTLGVPGRWTPDPLNPTQEAWGPEWGGVRTFSITSGSQFTAPPMPALDSAEYAAAYNEVKDYGAVNSPSRTAVQEEIGVFWAYDREGMGTPHHLFNEILEVISLQEGNTLQENASLFATASVAMADAGVAAWHSKFDYDFWRPVTGIRDGDLDGNPLTIGDPNWAPLGAPGGSGTDFTPPFPTYVSGHATFGGALFRVLETFYGTDDIAFTLESDELPGVTRSFDSFSDAMAENGRSRVYLGIHWNFDDTVGQALGAEIADYIMSGPFIAAVPEPSTLGAALLAMLAGVRRRHG